MAKTFSFGVMHFGVAFGVVWLLTGDFVIGGMVATLEPAVNTVAYYFHERVWRRLEIDRQKPTPPTPCGLPG
jgi:uncharacterized membrane protein